MATVKHKFQSGKGDGPDSTRVKPSAWNDEHAVVTTGAGVVLGRDPSAPGGMQELPLAIDLAGRMQGRGTEGYTPPGGTSAQRPSSPRPGEMRWNTDTNTLEIYGLSGQTSWSSLGFDNFVPAGTLLLFPFFSPPQANWFFCNGQSLQTALHPKLFAYIGYVFGGSGANFNVPNYQGYSLMCSDQVGTVNGFTIGASHMGFGAVNVGVSLGIANLPPHTHNIAGGPVRRGLSGGLGGGGIGASLWDIGTEAVATDGVEGAVAQTFYVNTLNPGVGLPVFIKGG